MSDPAAAGPPRPRSRREIRLAQRQAQAAARRWRRAALAAGVIVLLVLAGQGVRTLRDGDESAVAPPKPQSSVLLQVRASDGSAVGSALLAHDPDAQRGVVLVVPPSLQVAGAGGQLTAFGRALTKTDNATPRAALARLLDIQIDGSWVLDVRAFATLVDQVGGIEVQVDRDVAVGPSVVARRGLQRLDGAAAVAYATYRLPGEAEAVQVARLSRVLAAVASQLPLASQQVEALTIALGDGSASTLSGEELGGVVSGLGRAADARRVTVLALPIRARSGGVAPIDEPRARQIVETHLAGSRVE